MSLNDLVPHWRGRRHSSQSVSPFERMHEEMDRLFDDFLPQFSGTASVAQTGLLASVDLTETDDALELTADLPGMKEEDIDITLRNSMIVINAERKQESEEKKKNFYRSERFYGAFSRTVPLPCEVQENAIKATFNKGVLKLHMPKTEAARQTEHKIKIKSS